MRYRLVVLAVVSLMGFQSLSLAAASNKTGPSTTSAMICTSEGQEAIANAVHYEPIHPVVGSWADRIYSCRYRYANGSIRVSVKELDDEASTTAYYEALAKRHGERAPFSGIGSASFVTKNGSVVVRKDFNVLFVDVAKLPKRFGVPPRYPVAAAIAVASAIMDCWTHG